MDLFRPGTHAKTRRGSRASSRTGGEAADRGGKPLPQVTADSAPSNQPDGRNSSCARSAEAWPAEGGSPELARRRARTSGSSRERDPQAGRGFCRQGGVLYEDRLSRERGASGRMLAARRRGVSGFYAATTGPGHRCEGRPTAGREDRSIFAASRELRSPRSMPTEGARR